MSKVIIDGKKFILALGLSEAFTAQEVCNKLMELTDEERKALQDECVIRVESSPVFTISEPDSFYNKPYHAEPELRKLIKYEKNSMMRLQYQRELSTMNMHQGKHKRRRYITRRT